MPRRDLFHDTVREALIADGWKITHDPYTMSFGSTNVFVDLGAETPAIAAEKAGQKIAVEIKGFRGLSQISDLEDAIGQFTLYNVLLKRKEADRTLYLAIPLEAYENMVREADVRDLLEQLHIPIIVADEEQKVVVRWIER